MKFFQRPHILCLRKLGLHRIYYIENVGFLWGGRDIGGRGWLPADSSVDTVEQAALMVRVKV